MSSCCSSGQKFPEGPNKFQKNCHYFYQGFLITERLSKNVQSCRNCVKSVVTHCGVTEVWNSSAASTVVLQSATRWCLLCQRRDSRPRLITRRSDDDVDDDSDDVLFLLTTGVDILTQQYYTLCYYLLSSSYCWRPSVRCCQSDVLEQSATRYYWLCVTDVILPETENILFSMSFPWLHFSF